MKWFWKLISKIYSDLFLIGLKIKVPKFLFNKAKKKLDLYLVEYIIADTAFTEQERDLITFAIKNLEYFCNGLIKINICYELTLDNINQYNNYSLLIKVDSNHPLVIKTDESMPCKTLGLCESFSKQIARLYLVTERFHNNITFITTTMHELGHFIGLGHTETPSVMHKINFSNVLYFTYEDAKEFGKAWQIDPEQLNYFKL